ncbi:MAG: phosphatase PAP2 family protein [Oligoflexia bacterium]|nr:phosphatase PAP2 family protein [Oligoflexia bacterium]
MAYTKINRLIAYPLTYFYVMAGYIITNYNSLNPPQFLPLTFLDMQIPFLEWTGWIYCTVYFVPLIAAFVVTKDRDIKAMLTCFLVLSTLCFIVFLMHPTTYPRPTLSEPNFFNFPLQIAFQIDRPSNCWPSLHVVYAFLTAFFVQLYKPRLGSFLLLWAIVIAISTLTVKQHYLWDVLAGYLLARVGFKASMMFWSRQSVVSRT